MMLAVIHVLALASAAPSQALGKAPSQALGKAPSQALGKAPDFSALHDLLSGWLFTTEYAVTIGNKDGRLFSYESGKFKLDTQIPTGSTSKWPSAMMFASLVDDGTIGSLDDRVSKYLPYWTTNASDLRSSVTLRMLLTFTSGFGGGHPGDEMNTRAARQYRATAERHNHTNITACDAAKGTIAGCAEAIYRQVGGKGGKGLIGVPGKVYSYNSNHLQLAAGVAVAATGLSIHDVVHKYLFEPYGMSHSYYDGAGCPDFAGSLVTTGHDYEKFLAGVLTHTYPSAEVRATARVGASELSTPRPFAPPRGVPAVASLAPPHPHTHGRAPPMQIIRQSEVDATPFLSDYYTLYGNYGFGHFLSCFDSTWGFTDACKAAQVHMDPGAFGFIPLIDRKHGYYLQVVAAEIAPTGSYPLSGIPEYLAVAIKAHVDAILSSAPPSYEDHMHYTPSLLSLGVADVNYMLNCKLHPAACM